jgi:protein-S-isoprenylcysteine O-methyltransferase Ste14
MRLHRVLSSAGWDARLIDLGVGLSLATRGAFDVVGTLVNGAAPNAVVHVSLGGLQILVGGLFLGRSDIVRRASTSEVLAALPSLVVSALTIWMVRPLAQWPLSAVLLFATGAALTVLSLSCLGRSFAILPAARAIVTRGPYRWLRHPGYAAQVLMLSACAWMLGGGLGVALWGMLLATIAIRIFAEERVLGRDVAYREYRRRVRWRLVPGVW